MLQCIMETFVLLFWFKCRMWTTISGEDYEFVRHFDENANEMFFRMVDIRGGLSHKCYYIVFRWFGWVSQTPKCFTYEWSLLITSTSIIHRILVIVKFTACKSPITRSSGSRRVYLRPALPSIRNPVDRYRNVIHLSSRSNRNNCVSTCNSWMWCYKAQQ